jgi:hypothetical protein
MPEYTADDLFGQAFVAFGQGAGAIRVHHTTIREIRSRYERFLERALEHWEEDAVQALERVRATGRLAALLATQDGRTAVSPKDFSVAAERVERADLERLGKLTRICADRPRTA